MADLRLVGRAAPVAPPQAASRRDAGRPDLRRTVRRALRAGGEPIAPRVRSSRASARGGSCCCSTSAARWSRTPARFVRFLHAAVVGRHAGRGVRARHPPHPRHPRAVVARSRRRACARPRDRVADWSGGTRLGEGLRAVQRRVGRPGHGPGRGRRDPLRRLGPRRARGCSPSRWRACTGSRTGSCG